MLTNNLHFFQSFSFAYLHVLLEVSYFNLDIKMISYILYEEPNRQDIEKDIKEVFLGLCLPYRIDS
jgi:hypothetical protein